MNKKHGMNEMKKSILFCGVFLIYSLSGIFSKMAGLAEFGGTKFFMCYAMVLLIMGIYAVLWQQLLKRYPLSDVFLYKSTTIIWGSIFGCTFFHESISAGKMIGILFIIVGICYVGKKE